MRTVLLRLWDLLLLCFILSPASCALYYYGIIPNNDTAYALVLVLAVVIFVIFNVFMLRRCFFEIRDYKIYYILNYAAYGVFILITALVYFIFGQVPYAWMFNTLKLATFSHGLSTIESTAISHFVMLIVIALAPIGMDWVWDFTTAKSVSENDQEK